MTAEQQRIITHLDRELADLRAELDLERQLAEADGHPPRVWRAHDGLTPRFYTVVLGQLFVSWDQGVHWENAELDDAFYFQACRMLGLPVSEPRGILSAVDEPGASEPEGRS